ncbi:MAG: hypothetical protein C4344_04985, partial [Acidimicrobiia bacterium]
MREMLADLRVPDTTGSLFDERPVRVGLLTNRVTGRERERLLADLGRGAVDILVGTH